MKKNFERKDKSVKLDGRKTEMTTRHHPCYSLGVGERAVVVQAAKGKGRQKNQSMQRPRRIKQHDDFSGLATMSCKV